MPHHDTHAPNLGFPRRTSHDRDAARRRLTLLTDWRTGALATAIVMAGELPFAIAWRVSYLTAVAASIIIAAILAIGTHIARHRRLQTMALSPELVQLPDLSAERRRLESARTRRALAAGLRRTADPIQPPRRLDPCPVLTDRIAPDRALLLEVANALERTHAPDPTSIALLRELLTNGTSPLYNVNLPPQLLHTTLIRARAGLVDKPTYPPDPPRSN